MIAAITFPVALKNARRVATGYDRTTTSFLGFVQPTAVRLGPKHFALCLSEERASPDAAP